MSNAPPLWYLHRGLTIVLQSCCMHITFFMESILIYFPFSLTPKHYHSEIMKLKKKSFNPSWDSDVTAASHESCGWESCILYCRLGHLDIPIAPSQDPHRIRHHKHSTVGCCQSHTKNNRGEMNLHPSGLQFPQVTFYSKSTLWTCIWNFKMEMLKFWPFPLEIWNFI